MSLKSTLALLGGKAVRQKPFPPFNTMGQEEIDAVTQVMKTGVLSSFLGSWPDGFLGGPEVQALEKEWAAYFKVPHAISMNSATSALYAAMGALNIAPGDEVIVPPLSMSASASAPVVYGAKPVFADVSKENFMYDLKAFKKAISSRTKAAIVVNLFGHPAHWDELKEIAQKHGVALLEDNAQGPGALYHGKFAGTLGDIGVFSLNYHKHIHTGEGGIAVTRNPELAQRLQLIRNHAEAVVDKMEDNNTNANLLGYNYRLTELQAAIGRSQLKKMATFVDKKHLLGERLRKALTGYEGFDAPQVTPDCRHVYYTFPLRISEEKLGISRETFVKALRAEGIPIVERYTKPLYLLPLFQKRFGFERNTCPNALDLFEKELCYLPWCSYEIDESDVDEMATAIRKILENRQELRS